MLSVKKKATAPPPEDGECGKRVGREGKLFLFHRYCSERFNTIWVHHRLGKYFLKGAKIRKLYKNNACAYAFYEVNYLLGCIIFTSAHWNMEQHA